MQNMRPKPFKVLVLLLCFSLVEDLVLAGETTDYCSEKFCQVAPYKHVACGPLNFGEMCSANATFLDMSWYKHTILDFHNFKRNSVAGGAIAKLWNAARMSQMEWDDELATVASYEVARCAFGLVPCRSTAKYPNVSSSSAIYRSTSRNVAPDFQRIVKLILIHWWEELENFNPKFISHYPKAKQSESVRHIAKMLNERNVAIGCAAVRSMELERYIFYFSCNYASSIMHGQQLYKRARRPGSHCKSGVSVIYDHLCTPYEVYP